MTATPSTGTTWLAFAPVAPGLEFLLSDELAALAPGSKPTPRRGGVELRLDAPGVARVLLEGRLADGLRVRLTRFRARHFSELDEALRRLPWSVYLEPGAVPPVHVTSHRSRLYHSEAVAERVLAVLSDRAPDPFRVDAPAIHVRLTRDHATVSIDASGEPLHRRGWRLAQGDAPLRETVAAACLRAANLSADQAFWDPFCGAGTLVIEAAGAGPVPSRRFAFEAWRTHDAAAFAAQRAALEAVAPPSAPRIGSDSDPAAVAAARANAERAGVHEACGFHEGDFEVAAEQVPSGAAVVTNPPWGRRLDSGPGLRRTLERFGQLLARRVDLGPVVVLTGAARFEADTSLPWRELAGDISIRGQHVRLLQLDR
jgi:putative N6-adenine-specific DNA methylase